MAKTDDGGWKKVGGEFPPTFLFKKKGTMLEGTLVAKRERKEGSMKYKDSSKMVYEIETAKGNVSLFGSGLLDTLLKDISTGEQIRIIYGGKDSYVENGEKRTAHKFDIYRKY